MNILKHPVTCPFTVCYSPFG